MNQCQQWNHLKALLFIGLSMWLGFLTYDMVASGQSNSYMVAQSSKDECFVREGEGEGKGEGERGRRRVGEGERAPKPASFSWPDIGSAISVIFCWSNQSEAYPDSRLVMGRTRLHVLMREYQDHIIEKCVKEGTAAAISKKDNLPYHLPKQTKSKKTTEESVLEKQNT